MRKIKWEWLERAATLVALLCGLTAFIWQLQERVEQHQESFISSIVLRPNRTLALQLLNTGTHPLSVRRVMLSTSAKSTSAVPLYPDSTHTTFGTNTAFAVEPDNFITLQSDALSELTVKALADSGYVNVVTFRETYVRPFDPTAIRVALREFALVCHLALTDEEKQMFGRC